MLISEICDAEDRAGTIRREEQTPENTTSLHNLNLIYFLTQAFFWILQKKSRAKLEYLHRFEFFYKNMVCVFSRSGEETGGDDFFLFLWHILLHLPFWGCWKLPIGGFAPIRSKGERVTMFTPADTGSENNHWLERHINMYFKSVPLAWTCGNCKTYFLDLQMSL